MSLTETKKMTPSRRDFIAGGAAAAAVAAWSAKSYAAIPGANDRVRTAIVGAGDPPLAAERDRLARLSQVLAAPIEKAAALVPSGRASVAGTTARRSAVSH